MKKLGIYLMTILVVCLSFIFAACTPSEEETKDEIKLNKTAITLDVGTSETLTATTNVQNGVQWATSNAAIATVESGKITAISAGTATITATAGTASATCTVTVNEVQEYAELLVDKTVVELKEGGASVSVTATFTVNDEAYACDFVWASENEDVATVENGSISPVGVGSTVVTVSVEYKGETYAADVDVQVKPDEYIQVSKGTMQLALVAINDDIVSDTFTATAYKSGVENMEVTLEFVSSNEAVATVAVEAGVATVTAVGEGACTISISYTSSQGKIETNVTVTVSRSKLVLAESLETPYVAGNTVLDVNALALQGTLEGIYAEGEKVALEDGVLDNSFVEKYKGIVTPVEVHTTLAIYEAELLIVVPYVAAPKQEKTASEFVDTPTYEGNAMDLGFPEGTETAYEINIENADGWTHRMITNVAADKDVFVFDVIVTEAALSGFRFTMWPAMTIDKTQGSYGVAAKTVDPSADADLERKIFILGENDKQPSSLEVETLYTVYFFLNEGETHVHFGMFTTGTVHVANIRCIDADEVVNDPTLPPPPISQGEDRNEMPTFDGDVTGLGFAEGTTVYQIVGPQSNTNDVKLVAQVDASGDNAYAKLDFVLSAPTTLLGLWITAANSHLGYYTVTPTGFTADGIGDASRIIFVTDANGEDVSAFEANKVYTLYVGLDGREATIQLTTWATLNLYVANVDCISASELPVADPRPPVEQGKEISILFIGNSFSDDTEAYMVDILLNLGYTNVDVGNLYIGGCDIDTHYNNITSGGGAYDFRMRSHNGTKYTEYVTTTVGGTKKPLNFAIAYKDWDIISVQQASGYSGQANSYSNLDALVDEVKKQATNPDVEFVFNMTWAYQADSTHAQFPDYNSNQMTMYNAIVNATQEKVGYTVVPNGTAIQNARTSFIGDTLTRDGYHLDLKIGRFIAGLTFVAKVTGADITDFAYAPNGVSEEQLAVAIESAQNAIQTPFAVTQSQVPDPDALYIYQGIDNTSKLPKFDGDVTELGFNSDEYVQEMYTIENNNPWGTDANGKTRESLAARIPMDVSKIWVSVKFAVSADFSSGNLFFAWGTNADGSAAQFTYISITGANAGGFVAKIIDMDGNAVTELKANTVYYLVMSKPGTNVFKLASMVKAESSVYFSASSVTYYDEDPFYIPEPDISGAVTVYDGDVTALGFAADSKVYTYSGSDKAAIKVDSTNYDFVDVQFVIGSGDGYFLAYVLKNGNYLNSGVSYVIDPSNLRLANDSAMDRKIQVFNANGEIASTLMLTESLYTLRVYISGVDQIMIGKDGSTIYLANVTHGLIADLPVEGPIKQGSGQAALPNYEGDETALGFEEDEFLQYMVTETMDNAWGTETTSGKTREQLAARIPGQEGKYVTIKFATSEDIASGSVFYVWGLLGSTHTINGGLNFSATDHGRILDLEGNLVTSIKKNTVYVLELYMAGTDTYKVANICSTGMELYFASNSVTCSDTSMAAEPEAPAPIVSGEATSTALSVYEGNVSTYGFAEGTTVYQLISGANSYNDRVKIAVDSNAYDYMDVEFVVVEGDWYFNAWVVAAGGMLDGNYLVAELGDGTQHATFGDGFAKHTPFQGGSGGNTRMQVLDVNGNVVIGGRTNGTRYVLRVFLDDENLTSVHLGQSNVTMLFANVTFGVETVA